MQAKDMFVLPEKGNYINGRYLNFIIDPKELKEMTVKDIPDQIYTGSEIKPNIEIPITDFESLEEGKDYTVKFIQNIENGTARVAITGKGNYTGVVEKSFTIKPKSLANVKIEEVASQTYTGKEVKPSLNVYDEQRNVKLVEGTDYEVAAFVNGEVRGSARPIYVEALDAYMFFLTIHGEGVEEVTFKCYDIYSDEEYSLNDRLAYSGNAMIGSINEPFMLNLSTMGIGENNANTISVYPNPTTANTTQPATIGTQP